MTGGDKKTAKELEDVSGDGEQGDLLVGCAAEKWPEGFGFSDTAFRIFILMASRRLSSDRFFTSSFRPEFYSNLGHDWVIEKGPDGKVMIPGQRFSDEISTRVHAGD